MGKLYSVVLSCCVLICVLTISAYAENESNRKRYGNCAVFTLIDDFTDKTQHILLCSDVIKNDDIFSDRMGDIIFRNSDMLVFKWESDISMVMLQTGEYTFHPESLIPIVFRIDRGQVRRWEWEWLGDVAFTSNLNIFNMLLNELQNGKGAVFRVGDKRGVVMLDGAKDAVKDFKSRISETINWWRNDKLE